VCALEPTETQNLAARLAAADPVPHDRPAMRDTGIARSLSVQAGKRRAVPPNAQRFDKLAAPIKTSKANQMLTLMQRVAQALAPRRGPLIGLGLLSGCAAGVSVVGFEAHEADLILFPALVITLWSVLGVVYIDLFTRIPSLGPGSGDGWRLALRKMHRGLYWALAVGYLVLGIVAADVSLSIAREWLVDRSALS
jgi:hypothetical protein